MLCHKLTTVLVITLSVWGQVRSQDGVDDGVTRVVVNGPTGFSVEAEEERRQLSEGPPRFVNGPTAFSVEAENRKNGVEEGAFEEVEEDLQNSSDSDTPKFQETDVDLESLDNEEDGGGGHMVNGHTGSSALQDELNSGNRGVISTDPKHDNDTMQRPDGFHLETTDWSTDAPQWSFKGGEWALVSLPDKDNHPTIPAPQVPSPALVVVTQEPLKKVHAVRIVEGMENVTLHYTFYLSEGEKPLGVPELKVYQVIDETSTEVASEDRRGAWGDRTVSLPQSGSFEIVFEGRLNKLGNEIAIDDITISGISVSVPAGNDAETNPEDTAVDEGGEMKVDVTTETPDEVSLPPGGDNEVIEGTAKPGEGVEGTEKPGDTGEVTENPQEVEEKPENTEGPVEGTENPDAEAGAVTENPEETLLTTVNSDILLQGNDSIDVVESTDLPLQGNETDNAAISEFTDIPEESNETISKPENNQGPSYVNDTFDLTEAPQFTLEQEKEVETGNDSDITEAVGNVTGPSEVDGDLLNNSTEVPGVNLTVEATVGGNNSNEIENSTLPTNLTGIPEIENATLPTNLTGNPEIENATLPTNMTGNLDYNNTNNFTSNPLDSTPNQGIVTTQPSVLTINATNTTESSNNNATGEGGGGGGGGGGDNTTSIHLTTREPTANLTNPLGNATTDQGNAFNATSTPLIMTNSTSPSGTNNTSSGNGTSLGGSIGEDDGSSTWSAFKVFLIICLLGVAVLGFLYWRRQKRRDDEIPVFSRSTHSDYHNPTFTDDDANFASRGTGNNYKSFE